MRFVRLSCLSLIAASLAACSGSVLSVAPQPAPAFRVSPASLGKGVKHVFLSDAVFNTVAIFTSGGTRTIGGFNEPQGITTDASGTLYVADTINQRIAEFAPPYPNAPSGTISTPGEWPVDVAVAKNGMVAAMIICKAAGSQCGGPGSVEIFTNKNARSPCAVVSGDSKISRILWGGFDAGGTLYVAGVNNYTTAEIGVVRAGCSATALTVLKPTIAISFVAGVQVDTKGRVAIIDSRGFSGAPTVDVFAPARIGSHKLKLLTQGVLDDTGVVSSFALTRDGTRLFTAEPHYSLLYSYPGGGTEMGQLTPPPSGGDLIEGVAVTPAEVP